jgi:hypothetical protein
MIMKQSKFQMIGSWISAVAFVIAIVFIMALPAKAASLELVPNWGASGVPTNLSMYI